MAGSNAKKYRIYLSADGTSSGTKTELECQRDATINPGKTLNRTVGKDCTHSFVVDDGFSASTTFMEETPLGTGQALAWAAHDAETPTYCWIESTETGGQSYVGDFYVVISSIGLPVEGVVEYQLELSIDGSVTRAAVA